MTKRAAWLWSAAAVLALVLSACGEAGTEDSNPLLDEMGDPDKADTAYYNPDGLEVEVDLEGDVEATAYKIWDGPAEVGQYALTYLRNRNQFYLESLAEISTSDQLVEWQVDGSWITAAQARSQGASGLRHWRLRGVNAVLLHDAADGVQVGSVFTAEVPLKPFTTMADAGDKCADPDAHMTLDQSIYWYQWNPDRAGCDLTTQQLQITVSRMLPSKVPYPEYDQLIADGRITMVILFGQIDDDPLTDSDSGMRNMKRFATWLKQAKYTESATKPVPKGRRFSKRVGGVELVVDLYSPYDFGGLGDSGNFSNFQQAISQNEIVAYDGHSMLGASDFWSRPTYPSFYQIFLYGGCLGYEYYVRPIMTGKGGWDKLDIMSAVVEVTAPANDYAGPFLSKLQYALSHKYNQSWKSILGAVRTRVGDSTFGVSGVRDNCYSPSGSLCGTNPDPGTSRTYQNTTAKSIPDDSSTGATSTLSVPDSLTIGALSLELNVAHTYVGDLSITLGHGGTDVVVWDNAGGSAQDIHQTFNLTNWNGQAASGTWTLKAVDGAAQDTGRIESWKLVITPQ
ncbi:MAG TPA: proprotein convertase P-domain-containing protein [Myxococcota bacterium]|nr:proprotein convertase P-domain-containing protein [Myxococcota bacterium]HRY96000.1 proprotein convertase P-domain-containing protein [Myxococcota bacterium]HSA22473.1 proprotein convertase P-domain-containing protein [Myxococcota bacterium]